MNWNRITIHHTASRDASAAVIRRWHLARLFEGRKLGLSRGFTDIGYHFVIRKNGKLEAGRPLSKIGAHVKGKNRGNIGVCLTGNFQKHHPTKNQYSTLRTVLKVLKHAYQISSDQIFLHKGLAPTLCPGKNFNPSEIPFYLQVNRLVRVNSALRPENQALFDPYATPLPQTQLGHRRPHLAPLSIFSKVYLLLQFPLVA